VTRHSQMVVDDLRRIAEMQRKRMKPVLSRPAPVRPSEQVRRFLAGEERWRVEAGEITPADYAAYEMEMLKVLGLNKEK